MGSSMKIFLVCMYHLMLYNCIYKVWCIPIEMCQQYLSSKLGGNTESVDVLLYLFNNGSPSYKKLDLNAEPDIRFDDLSAIEIRQLNGDILCYITDIKTNVEVSFRTGGKKGSDSNENDDMPSVIVPTIGEFCYEYALNNPGIISENQCEEAIRYHIKFNFNNISRYQIFKSMFQRSLEKFDYSNSDMLSKFKTSVMTGATTPTSVSALFDVNLFCIYQYTDELKEFINIKRIKVGVNDDGTPIFQKYETKKRSRDSTNKPKTRTINLS